MDFKGLLRKIGPIDHTFTFAVPRFLTFEISGMVRLQVCSA